MICEDTLATVFHECCKNQTTDEFNYYTCESCFKEWKAKQNGQSTCPNCIKPNRIEETVDYKNVQRCKCRASTCCVDIFEFCVSSCCCQLYRATILTLICWLGFFSMWYTFFIWNSFDYSFMFPIEYYVDIEDCVGFCTSWFVSGIFWRVFGVGVLLLTYWVVIVYFTGNFGVCIVNNNYYGMGSDVCLDSNNIDMRYMCYWLRYHRGNERKKSILWTSSIHTIFTLSSIASNVLSWWIIDKYQFITQPNEAIGWDIYTFHSLCLIGPLIGLGGIALLITIPYLIYMLYCFVHNVCVVYEMCCLRDALYGCLHAITCCEQETVRVVATRRTRAVIRTVEIPQVRQRSKPNHVV